MLPSSQRERRVSRLNRTGNNTTGWARRLTALLVTACLVMAMALPVYAEEDLLPDAPGEVELLEDEQGTASGEDTVPPEQNAATPVPDAATPEPEQSAEPEQPAPTETPEPTAEPTPTPEPAATATATPVPTVTPTATPEPTEQPQMDAEEAEDMDRALGVSTQSNQFTVYFAVPSSWEVTKNSTITFNAKRGNGDQAIDGEIGEKLMSLVLDKITSKGQRIYKINGDKTICPWGGYVWMQFTLDGSHKVKVTAPPEENNTANHFVKVEVFNDRYYDGDANSENGDVAWNDADWANALALPDPAGHTAFGSQKMVFENLSDSALANVTAVFTEQDSSGNTTATQTVKIGDVAKDKKQGFEIPTSACSSVQFFAENGKKQLSTSYNFYEQGTDENTFLYNASKKYCFTYKGNNQSTWGTPQGKQVIYFDATFSGLSYENETSETHGAIGCGMPTNDGKLWCYLTGDGKAPITKQEMKRLKDTNIWYYEVPEGYTKIRFASWAVENENAADNGNGTAMMDIPADLSEPCFFADASDDVIYKGGNREGYWAEKGTLRDAETWKNPDTKVVDIKSAEFTEKPNTKYVTSTLYDYYTDYELNGKNRNSYDSYDQNFPALSHRNWVPFRQFDQAISDYYQSYNKNTGKSIIYPIYTGHFQPNTWDKKFVEIASTLNLYGWSSYDIFIAANNSNYDIGGKNEKNSYAFQGIVANERDSDGDIVMNGTTLKEPHFNEKFLTSQNSKNAKLGEVYHNVEFPFTQEEVFVEPEQNDQKKGEGVKYWWFDSSKTSLYLRKDTNSDQLYLGNDSTGETTAKYTSDASLNVDSANSTGSVSTKYGFFPFNENTTSKSAARYNYGYGAKLEIPFTLTSTGTVEDKYKNEIPIRFYFSGDDDVWVFIDDQLVLDIGGDHARVSGVLEFDQRDNKKNTVTSYVSRVKNSKTGNYGAENCDENKHETETSITYLGTTEKYYKNASVHIDNLSTGKHTLTMYYMERGMWESNMAVAFNFPDNNELQVQKEVDLTNVTDDDFKNCFKNQKIFNFTIKNQATHYGTKDAAGPDESGTPSKEVDLTADVNEIKPATKPTESNKGDYIFELADNPNPDSKTDTKQVLHWYARYMDTEPVSAARDKRRGILTLNNPINIEKMRFLTFQVYVSQKDGDGLSLNNLYLELLDDKGVQKGSLGTSGINGATYGTVEVKTDKWVTVKLDLHKMKEQSGFNDNVQTIRVGDNYSRNIYFRNFTFIPKAVPSTMTGFTTDQKDIPDYGSAKSGQLEKAENAQYTSNKDSDTQLVDDAGRFVLEDGETVTFSDQFRRGSYISLKEKLNPSLYDTTWTVYENGQAVTSMKGDSESVTVTDTNKSLDKQEGSSPNDGRTEKIRPNDDQTGNSYTENKPSADTIVFRSYKDPDETSSTLTKLKVKYVNTVKTGGLKIQKQAAAGEENTIKGTYTFKVTFNDVGGEGLEEKPIERTVTIDMSTPGDHTATITGIPVGTRYTIEEVAPEDGSSRLQSVTVPPGCNSAHLIKNNTMVEGVIEESKDPKLTAIFTNTKRTLINIEFNKLWEDADGTEIGTANQPDEIHIQLQRRLKTDTGYTDWEPVKYPTTTSPDPNYVIIKRGDNGWKFTFSNLDQYPINGSAKNNYIYRIVEGTVKDGSFTPAAADGTITINGNTYVVTAKATQNSETNSAGSSTGNTATVTPDGTITGGSGKIELTNTLQNPKFGLNIIKKDAEKDEHSNDVPLSGVEFKLEKLVETTTEGKTQWVVDKNYKFDSTKTDSITGTTGTDGKITPNPFKNLEPGTYRLTETKAHPGYNLLAQPIKIQFTQDGKCYIDGQAIEDEDKFKPGANNTYTMNLTVLNRKTPELPHTGADAPSLWLLIGMPLAVAGLLIFTFRYNRKGGRRH